VSSVPVNYTLANGSSLDLQGATVYVLGGTAYIDGVVVGSGALLLTDSAIGILSGLALVSDSSLDIGNAAVQVGAITLGGGTSDTTEITVGAGASYTLQTDNNGGGAVVYAAGTATFRNEGSFTKNATDGTGAIAADFETTGTLAVDLGTLALTGATDTLGGTLDGAGELDLRGGGTFSLAAGAAVSVATLTVEDSGTQVTLNSALSYGGRFTLGQSTDLALNGQALTLTGSGLLVGGITGPGSVVVEGSFDAQLLLLTGGATLVVAGTLTQDSHISLGAGTADAATVVIESGGSYALLGDDQIAAAGTAAIRNSGTFEKLGDDGVSTVDGSFVNQAKVIADAGTIDFAGTLTNDGTVSVAAATVQVAGALSEGTSLNGVFDIGTGGVVALAGTVDAAQSFAFSGSSGALKLSDPAGFAGSITGFAAGDTIDLVGLAANGLSYSGGVLTVTEEQYQNFPPTLEVLATYSLNLPGIADASALTLVNDNAGGTEIVLNDTGPAFTNPVPEIITDYYTVDAAGTWADGGNWYQVLPLAVHPFSETLHVQPGITNDVEVDPAGTSSFTVTYNETDTVNQIAGNTYATLEVTGGTLTVDQGGLWGGGFDNSGGTFDAVSGWTETGPNTLAEGATDEVDSGTFAVGAGTLAGTVTGQGEFLLLGGANFTIDAGFNINAGTWDLAVNGDGFGANTTLHTDLGYAGTFLLNDYTGNSSNLFLNGHTLSLSGQQRLNGYISGTGTLALSGTAEISGQTVNNSATIADSGTVIEDGPLSIGSNSTSDTASVVIAGTGTWDLLENASITGSVASTIDNAGLLEKTGGTGFSNIGGAVFSDTGTIEIALGALGIGASLNTIAGAIGGPGELVLDGGPSFQIDAGTTITTPTLDLAVNGDGGGSNTTLNTDLGFAGTFILADYSGNSANLFLDGHTLTLSGQQYLNGYISGTGNLALTGSAEIGGLTVNNSATVTVTGSVEQDGGLTIGTGSTADATVIDVAAAGTWDIVQNTNVSGADASTFETAGLLEKTGGDGFSSIAGGSLFSDTGQIVIATGALGFGAAVNDFAGAISGAGELVFDGGPSFQIDTGTTITTPTLDLAVNGDGFGSSTTLNTDLAYTGSFLLTDYSGNSANLFLNGHTLSLSGSAFLNGYIAGIGEVDLAGSADIPGLTANGGVTIIDTGIVTQAGPFTLGGGLQIGAAGTYDLTTDDGIVASSAVTITNAGLLEKTTGTGTSKLQGSFSNSGTVDAATGQIEVSGSGGTLNGTITGAGAFAVGGGGTYVLVPTLKLETASFGVYDVGTDLVLQADLAYQGTLTAAENFGTLSLDLGGHTLDILTAAVLNASYGQIDVLGGGSVVIGTSANATLASVGFAGGMTLDNRGVLTEGYIVALDSDSGSATSVVQNEATGTIDLVNLGNAIVSTGTASLIVNAGLIQNTGGTAAANIDVALNNTGVLAANTGDIALYSGGTIGGTLSGSEIDLRGGGIYTLTTSLALDAGVLGIYDARTDVVLQGDITYAGTLSVAENFSTLTIDLDSNTLDIAKAAVLNASYGQIDVTNGGSFIVGASAQVTLYSVGFAGGVTLVNMGVLTEGYTITFDSDAGAGASTLLNEAGATIDLLNLGTAITTAGSSASIDNAGLIENTGGTAVANISVVLDNTGVLNANTGDIALSSGGTIGGTLSGTEIDLRGGTTYMLAPTIQIDTSVLGIYDAHSDIELEGNLAYAGTLSEGEQFSTQTLDLSGFTLSLSNTVVIGASYGSILVTGGGDMMLGVQSQATLASVGFAGGDTLDNAGNLIQTGEITLDSDGGTAASVLLNEATGTITLLNGGTAVTATAVLGQDSSPATFDNLGLVQESATSSATSILVAFDNSGTFLATSGSAEFTAPVVNDGSIEASGGSVEIVGGLSGTGAIVISNDGTAGIVNTVTAGQTIDFAGAGTLYLGDPSGFSGLISGFGGADVLSLYNLSYVAPGTADIVGSDTLQIVDGGITSDVQLAGDYSHAVFTVGSSDVGATQVTVTIPCFAAGTRIATARGDIAVEELRVGDSVVLHHGGVHPVVWLGHRRIDCARHPRPHDVWPVRVSAGVFGGGLPRRDLLLSPDHAVFVDGVLIPIRHLIDGHGVAQERRDAVTYWHVELPQHAVLLAEGLPAESFLDTGNRAAFANAGAVVHLQPDFSRRLWDGDACAPIVVGGPALNAVRRRLAGVALARRSSGVGRARR